MDIYKHEEFECSTSTTTHCDSLHIKRPLRKLDNKKIKKNSSRGTVTKKKEKHILETVDENTDMYSIQARQDQCDELVNILREG